MRDNRRGRRADFPALLDDHSPAPGTVQMIANHVNGLTYYQFESLPPERVRHGIFARLGGVSHGPFATLNLSSSVPDDPEAVAENRRRFYAAMGLERESAIRTVQVHGARVAAVDADDVRRIQQGTDGLVTRTCDLPLVMAFADCVPLLLFDPVEAVVGIAHAGWRGLVRGVVEAAVRCMEEDFGCRAAHVRAGIGPAIGACCYEVGSDVLEAAQTAFGDVGDLFRTNSHGAIHLDLWAASEMALRRAGVEQIEHACLCTACHVDEFYSHRREGGRTGRFGAIIALRP
jgi:polyphenol oxidase